VDYVEDLERKAQTMSKSSNDFTVSRFIKARRSVVWQAWTVPTHLEQWWCPAPMTCKVMGLDARHGGAFEIVMRGPNGEEMSQTGAFLDIVPEARLIFTTALTAEWRPAATPLPITAIISMADEGEGTRYETRVLYKDADERRKLGEMRFEAGWSLAIDQLEALVSR
jgi:uncharacterized protein YndB with AHSA1/START domain